MYIGIDLGGTNIAAGIVDENGNIICKGSVPTLRERGNDAIVADMAKLSLKLVEECGLKPYSQRMFVQQLTSAYSDITRGIDTLGKRRILNGIKLKDPFD